MEDDGSDIKFVSLWIPIIDELRFFNKEPLKDIVGGGGTFATLGARIFCPPPKSKSVGWVVPAGEDDFPEAAEEVLRTWDINFLLRKLPGQRTTRAVLQYESSTFGRKQPSPTELELHIDVDTAKTYRYIASPLAISPSSLELTPMLASASFHLFGSPETIIEQVPQLLALREAASIQASPIFVFEQGPLFYDATYLPAALEAAKMVDVFSPNHIELAKLCGELDESKLTGEFLEGLARRFVESGIGREGKGVIVVRAGERGCFFTSREMKRCKWFPAYYKSQLEGEDANKILDPTGAGNAFLGAFARCLVETGSHEQAAVRGIVAASFVVEQIGVPILWSGDEGVETWNGESAWWRLERYQKNLGGNSVKSV